MAKKEIKQAKSNQGNQWGNLGPEGNINTLPDSGGTDKSGKKPAVTSKEGRNLSIGKSKAGKRRAKR